MSSNEWVLCAGGGLLAWTSLGFVPRWLHAPVVRNYRGHGVPVTLGWGLALGVCVVLFSEEIGAALGPRAIDADRLVLGASVGAIFLAGLYDDRRQDPARGILRQLGGLVQGRITPAIIKMAVVVCAGLGWTIVTHASTGRILMGTPVIAGAANLWNLLDVRPGRALKFGILATGILLAWRVTFVVGATLAASIALLPFDLRERAMLGDSGSNVLGFLIGVALFDRLGVAGLAVALGVILVLHALSETLTLSRAIEATAPLRWLDQLGRVRNLPEERRSAAE